MTSPRAISFAIKGLHAYNTVRHSVRITAIVDRLGGRLLRGATDHTTEHWHWIEPALTYGNAVIPEALLLAYLETGIEAYRKTARTTFEFLLSHLFKGEQPRLAAAGKGA
jgi:uncharacterized protein YyaL (SSP411 family)